MNSVNAFIASGDAARDNRQWAEAAASYREALNLDPSLAHIWVQYGHALKEGGDVPGAEAAYRRALALDDAADTHLQLAHVARLQGRIKEAAEHYRDALRIDPSPGHVWVQYGHALKDNGEWPAAEAAYRKALSLEDAVADTYVHLAHVLRQRGLMRESSESYRHALRLDPSLTHIWVQYGHALKEGGEWAAAETAYRKALELDENVADTHLQLGHILKLRGRTREAADAYATALKLDPNLRAAQDELNRLKYMLLSDDDEDSEYAQSRRLRSRLDEEKRRAIAADYGVAVEELPQRLRFVIIGTMGLCNASCIHCPTGKMETAHVPRTPMPMALFEKLIRGIADLGLDVTDQVSFGLFGDGLVDPFVIDRARLVRELLPDVNLSVNTNGAAYNRAKHKALQPLASVIALHVESLAPETYDKLMQPLRFANVSPKFRQLLEDFPGQVDISCPVSKLNLNELPAIREFFMGLGARGVHFDALSGRCLEDQTLYRSLALAPRRKKCAPSKGDDLIIDCDGKVLICCNDFQREEPIGNLGRESLVEILLSAERKRMVEQFANDRHGERTTCNRCFTDFKKSKKWRDIVDEVFRHDAEREAAAAVPEALSLT